VTFTLPAAATISSITPVPSIGGKTELEIGALSGCVADGTTTNQAGSICVVQVTFTPVYAGLHSLPIKVVTSAGTLQLGTIGTGVGAVLAFSPGITTIVAGTNCTSASLNCAGPSVADGGLATNGYLSGVLDFAVDSAGNIFLLLLSDYSVHRIDATTGIMTLVASGFYRPSAIALDSTGSIYVADTNGDDLQGNTVTRIDAGTGVKTNYAGCCANFSDTRVGVPAQQASLKLISSLQFDGAGNLYISQTSNILRVDAKTTVVTSYVGPTPAPGYMTGTAIGYSGDGGLATAALIHFPKTMSLDSAGNLYFSDQNNGVVRRVDAVSGIIITYAGSTTATYNDAYSGLATNTGVFPLGLANDAAGNLYIGDGNVVRLVSAPADTLFPIAGIALPLPAVLLPVQRATDIASAGAAKLDAAGNIYSFYAVGANQTVLRKIDVTTSLLGFPFRTSSNNPPTAPGTPYPGADTETTAITNIGNAPLVISAAPAVANSTANLGAFALDDPASGGCPTSSDTLAPGGSCLLAVDFTPKIAGANFGTLTVTDNAINGGGAQVVSLAGSGFGNALTVAPATLNFPGTLVGTTSASLTATVTNNAFNATAISPGTLGDTTDYKETDNCGTSIAGNTSCTLTFTFKPQSLGTKPSTFTLSGSIDPTQTITVSLTGTGTGALSISPTTITFPSTAVGATSAPLTSTLTNGNTSSVSLTAGSLTDSTNFTQSDNCNGQIAAGGSCTITFTFTPRSTGALSSTYSIATGSQGWTVALSGTGTAPSVTATLAPSTFAFNATTSFGATSQTATLTNTGATTLTITSITLGGANPTAFTQSNNCGTTLAAGATCSITLGLVNTSVGTFAATLTVADNATAGNQTATVAGTVTGVPQPTLAPSTLMFPSTTVGTTSTAQTLTLSNTGTAALSFSSISLFGTNASSFAQTNACPSTLAIGANCTISVTCTPTASGALSATLAANFPSPIAQVASALSCTGVTPTAPQATLTPATAAFGTVTVGTIEVTQVFTLTNAGTAALAITSISLSGTNASSFSISTKTCGTSLAAGASCTVTVVFTPTSAAAMVATLSVVDAVGTQFSALTGTGSATPPDFTISATPAIQSTYRGTSVTYTIQLASLLAGNPYNSAVTLSASNLPSGATATFSPAAVTPGTSPQTATLTVAVPALSAKTLPGPGRRDAPEGITLAMVALGMALGRRARRGMPRLLSVILLTGLAGLSFTMTGCGTGTGFAIPASTSTITVTATGGTTAHSTTVTLTIQ
jgi:sugar lactone lactonase YvrE